MQCVCWHHRSSCTASHLRNKPVNTSERYYRYLFYSWMFLPVTRCILFIHSIFVINSRSSACAIGTFIMLSFTYVSTAVIFDPKSALSFAATSVQSAFHFKFTYSRLVRDFIKSMSLFRMALVSNQSGSLFYDYFTT